MTTREHHWVSVLLANGPKRKTPAPRYINNNAMANQGRMSLIKHQGKQTVESPVSSLRYQTQQDE